MRYLVMLVSVCIAALLTGMWWGSIDGYRNVPFLALSLWTATVWLIAILLSFGTLHSEFKKEFIPWLGFWLGRCWRFGNSDNISANTFIALSLYLWVSAMLYGLPTWAGPDLKELLGEEGLLPRYPKGGLLWVLAFFMTIFAALNFVVSRAESIGETMATYREQSPSSSSGGSTLGTMVAHFFSAVLAILTVDYFSKRSKK